MIEQRGLNRLLVFSALNLLTALRHRGQNTAAKHGRIVEIGFEYSVKHIRSTCNS